MFISEIICIFAHIQKTMFVIEIKQPRKPLKWVRSINRLTGDIEFTDDLDKALYKDGEFACKCEVMSLKNPLMYDHKKYPELRYARVGGEDCLELSYDRALRRAFRDVDLRGIDLETDGPDVDTVITDGARPTTFIPETPIDMLLPLTLNNDWDVWGDV